MRSRFSTEKFTPELLQKMPHSYGVSFASLISLSYSVFVAIVCMQ